MRPLRAPFGKGFDPGMAPIFETEPQENIGMSTTAKKQIRAMLDGGKKGQGANYRGFQKKTGRSVSLARDMINKTVSPPPIMITESGIIGGDAESNLRALVMTPPAKSSRLK